MAESSPILILGAGTMGFAVACELARHGAPLPMLKLLARANAARSS